jgi:charged multivesicular body protein 1
MGNVVKGMDSAMKAMDLEKVWDIALVELKSLVRIFEYVRLTETTL